jgi:hypothetical protein
MFSTPRRLDRPWNPPNPLSNWYRVSLPGIIRPGSEADQSSPASAEVKKNVDLYIYKDNFTFIYALQFLDFIVVVIEAKTERKLQKCIMSHK